MSDYSDKYYAGIELAEEFGSHDRKELRDALSNKSVQRALKQILEEAREKDTLRGINLDTEGLIGVAETKGEVMGLENSVARLIEMSEIEEEDDA